MISHVDETFYEHDDLLRALALLEVIRANLLHMYYCIETKWLRDQEGSEEDAYEALNITRSFSRRVMQIVFRADDQVSAAVISKLETLYALLDCVRDGLEAFEHAVATVVAGGEDSDVDALSAQIKQCALLMRTGIRLARS